MEATSRTAAPGVLHFALRDVIQSSDCSGKVGENPGVVGMFCFLLVTVTEAYTLEDS